MSPDRVYLPATGARPGAGPTGPRPVSVLIVGYRRADLLASCLRTVREHLPGLRVLVWDNSGAQSRQDAEELDALIADHPDVHWTRSATNVGFAAAVNRLAEQAGDDDLLLLNPDAELLGPLERTLAAVRRPGVAAAAPLVLDESPDGRREWDVAHRRLGVVRALVAHSGYAGRLRGTALSDLYGHRPEQVEGYLTGACLLVSRAAWDDVGPFDEEYFLYGEESDWQARARRAGWQLLLVDEAGVRHRGHGTVAGDPLASRRSADLLRGNVALNLEHERGVHRADAFLAGMSVLDRVQRSSRRDRAAARPRRTGPAVVFTVNRLVFGGAERHHVVLAGELQRRGHDVTIVCMQRFGPLVREVDPAVRVVRQPWWAPLPDVGGGPAVVVSGDTNTETGFAALWRRAGRGRRWLVGAHIPPVPDGPTYGSALARVMRTADGFVGLSGRHLDELQAYHRLAPRTFVAPNGVARRADPAPPSRPSGSRVRLAMLSRIVEHKNPHLLVEALAGLGELDWELSIYGDGPDRARLQAMTPPDLQHRVHWRGWVDGPDVALRDCDLLCVPSGSEAFPLVILEAMARAVPVLASAVCSVPEMLAHGHAGLLVDPVDVPSWRQALNDVLTRPEALPELGRAGFARMRDNYTVEDMADAYEAAIAAVGT